MLKGRVLPSIFEWSHTTKCALDLNVFCKTDRVDDILEAVASSASFQIFTNGLTRLAMMMMMIVMVMLMRVMIMMMMIMVIYSLTRQAMMMKRLEWVCICLSQKRPYL